MFLVLHFSTHTPSALNIGALIIRIGFWGPIYYSYKKEPPKNIGTLNPKP